jgi:glycosyltransferase involved in cell wall biosynthesis
MKPLRILLILSELPVPFGHAVGRWYYVLLQGLVERGHRVTAFASCSKPEEIARARELFPAPHYDLRLYPHPRRSGLWSKWQTLRRPYSYTISPALRRDVRTEYSRGCDVLHLEGIWSGWLNEGCDPAKTVLNFHSLYDIDLEHQPAADWRAWLERTLRRRAESRLLRSCAVLVTLTPRLQEAVRHIAPKTAVHVVPLALDMSFYPYTPAGQRPTGSVISVIGSMDWCPSRSAAERLLTRLWPAIRSRVPTSEVQIVGWHAREALKAHLPLPGVTVAENVPDARPYFERTSVLLYAPVRGSGMKVKVLEAFAYGVPVVTTTEGVEGLPAQDQIHAGICDHDGGLIERTVGLLTDVARQERQRRAARSLVEVHCSPHTVLDCLEESYDRLLARQGGLVA